MKTFLDKYIMRYLLLIPLLATFSCGDFLDVVPDDTPTIESAFTSRSEAEKYLAGLFANMPSIGDPAGNPAIVGGDEVWFGERSSGINTDLWRYIARGAQNTNEPRANYYAARMKDKDGNDIDDLHGGKFLYTALRDCNEFLSRIDQPYDLYSVTKNRWIAEVKFLKAYFHFWLLRMYGPIPIIGDTNLELKDENKKLLRSRNSVDSVVNYICRLIDEACVEGGLPVDNSELVMLTEAGRPTVVVAKAFKAQVLVYAASPLFNGNEYPASVDPRYAELFPAYDQQKWVRAKEALHDAIQTAVEAGHRLYDFKNSAFAKEYVNLNRINDSTYYSMQVRGAVTDEASSLSWNPELVWGDPRRGDAIHRCSAPLFGKANSSSMGGGQIHHNYAPTLDIVEQFYTDKGLPLEEDPDWTGKLSNLYQQTSIERTDAYIVRGSKGTNDTATAVLHLHREPRFYGSISFARGRYYGATTSWIQADSLYYWEQQAIDWHLNFNFRNAERFPITGYICKKLTGFLDVYPETDLASGIPNITLVNYPFPIIRLADLYLMYAEALNEATPGGDEVAPDEEAYRWIDSIRLRTGLQGVKDSWALAIHPSKPNTKAGLREIIQHERMNEFAFEGVRFWDIRRWKLATKGTYATNRFNMNKDIRGLNVPQKMFSGSFTPSNFYNPQTLWTVKFTERDYFQPIKLSTIIKNNNLLQSPGW